MKYLLDTHMFLWSLFSPGKISAKANKIISDPGNEIFVSILSFWEISLKYNIGKLELYNVKPDDLPGFAEESGFLIFPIDVNDVSTFYKLPRDIHKDPFDRMLIWQALRNNITLISADLRFKEYEKSGLKILL